MLFVREVHTVRGGQADAFERSYRDGWMRILAAGDDARLIWYLHHAHGTGPAYTVVTFTAVRDGGAWERLALRLHDGDLQEWAAEVDAMRHDVSGRILAPVRGSPMQTVALTGVPTQPQARPPMLYMEDTGSPHAPLDDYIRFLDDGYRARIAARPVDERLLDIVACFQVAFGSHDRREVVLMQRIVDRERLLHVLVAPAAEHGATTEGYMSEALRLRDTWESRLLRTSTWSPLG